MAKRSEFTDPSGESFYVRIVARNQYVRQGLKQVDLFAEFLTWAWARLRHPGQRSVVVQRPSDPVRDAFPGMVTAIFDASDQDHAEKLRDEIGCHLENGRGLPPGACPPPSRWPALLLAYVLLFVLVLAFLLLIVRG